MPRPTTLRLISCATASVTAQNTAGDRAYPNGSERHCNSLPVPGWRTMRQDLLSLWTGIAQKPSRRSYFAKCESGPTTLTASHTEGRVKGTRPTLRLVYTL